MTYEDALARFGLNPDIRLRQMFELGKLAAQPAHQEPVQRYSPDGEGGMEVDSLGAWMKFTSPQAQPAQPQQEPAFWTRKQRGMYREFCEKPFTTDWEPLYTKDQL